MNHQYAVSVVLPTFNRDRQCALALESVLSQQELSRASCNQSFDADYQLLLIDDGSEEELLRCQQILDEYRGLVACSFYRLPQNSGVAAARNFGVGHARGKYLAFLDSDDLWQPEKLRQQYDFMEREGLALSQTMERWFRNDVFVNPRRKHQQPSGEAFERSLEICCISPSASMLLRELFLEMAGFDERLAVCEDYDLWLRITAKNHVGLLEETLVDRFAGHADQLSRSRVAMDRFRCYALFKLLLSDELTEEQSGLVRAVLSNKLRVLELGAKKRNNSLAQNHLSKVLVLLDSSLELESQVEASVVLDELLSLLLDEKVFI